VAGFPASWYTRNSEATQNNRLTAVEYFRSEVDDMRCDICFKSGMSGNNVSHSNRHTKTRFKANVHKQTIVQEGKQIKLKICSRCLRSLSKSPKVRKAVASLA